MTIGKLQHAANRFERQQSRINEGVRTGKLTQREATRLEKKEHKLARTIGRDMFEGGGKLSPQDAAKIQARQNQLSGKIYNQKHDGQTRGNTPLIDKREGNLQARVAKGVESGRLTDTESAALSSRLERLDAKIADARSDGVVTRQERRQLRGAENRISFSTFMQKHDAQVK
jgi:hypothetical protein